MNDTDQNMTNSYRHGAYFFIACQQFTHMCKNARSHHTTERGGLGVSN